MNIFVLSFLVLSVQAAVTLGHIHTNHECPFNEIFSECRHNDCQSTCEKPYTSDDQECPCIAGCICNEGYMRNDAGECVLPIQCECPVNEIYMDCHGCESTCRDHHRHSRCNCPCYLKCYCLTGYLRNDEGVCVLPKECKNSEVSAPPVKICPNEHETYDDCGTACPKTCENKDEPDQDCPLACVEGCFCDPGYVRAKNGTCVLPENCQNSELSARSVRTCPEHETYNDCGTACPKTCDNKDEPDQICILPCVEGCFCDPGYVRAENRSCVLPEDCPRTCPGEFEVFNICGTACPLTCENKDTPIICTDQCVVGCFCQDGYVRDESGQCILPENCPNN